MNPSYDIAALREQEFPWAARGDSIYLNHASTGPLPERSLGALERFNRLRAEPHRIAQEVQFGILDRARASCAKLVGASTDEIALMVNTGYGINLAARTLGLRDGDVVLGFDREFPANVYPWMALSHTGVEFRQVPCVNGIPDEARLHDELARDAKVRIVAVSWVQFASGYTVDLESLGAACARRGAHLVVDAIQGVGVRRLDLSSGHVSVLACGGQKWLLSPWGSGFTYVRRDLIQDLEPNPVSWMAVRDSDDFSRLVDYDLTWRSNARRFEMITLPYQDFEGMNASLDLLLELGLEDVERHVRSLTDRIVRWAEGENVTLVTPPDPARRAGIVSLAPADPSAASRRLTNAGVIHSLREGMIRLSPFIYNTADEVDRALALLL